MKVAQDNFLTSVISDSSKTVTTEDRYAFLLGVVVIVDNGQVFVKAFTSSSAVAYSTSHSLIPPKSLLSACPLPTWVFLSSNLSHAEFNLCRGSWLQLPRSGVFPTLSSCILSASAPGVLKSVSCAWEGPFGCSRAICR